MALFCIQRILRKSTLKTTRINKTCSARLQDLRSIHKKQLHFFALAIKAKNEIKNAIPFTIEKNKIGINLAKDVKEFYSKNYKTC